MSATLIATIGGLVTAISFGSGDWLTGMASKKVDAFEINLGVQFYSSLLSLPLLLFVHPLLPNADQFARLILTGLLITLAYLAMIRALATGSVGIVVPLANSYPGLTVILSIIFLGVAFSISQILAIVIIIAGASILAYEKNIEKIPLRTLHRETFLALLAAIFYGFEFFVLNSLINELQWQVINVVTSMTLLVIAIGLVSTRNSGDAVAAFKRSLTHRIPLALGFIFEVGAIAFYIGSHSASSVIIPTVISSAGPLVAAILSAVFDKEKLGWLKRAGAVILVGGIIYLNLA